MNKTLLLIFFLACLGSLKAQTQNMDSLHLMGICTEDGLCIPTIDGMPRPKGIEIYQERTPDYSLQSNFSDSDSTFSNQIRRNKIWSAKLNVPVINNDKHRLVIGLKYQKQEFAFEDPSTISNEFHRSLQDKPIRSVGMSIYHIYSMQGNQYLGFRGSFRLNGDFDTSNLSAHQKISFQGLYGFKRSRFITWGIGASYSYNLGRSSIYPVLFYKNRYNPKWALELFLPLSASVLYRPNDKNNFYFQTRLSGDNYNLNFDGVSEENLYLEKADVKIFGTYEREVYDFLWLSFSGGFRWNFNFDVSNSDAYLDRTFPIGNTDNITISNKAGDALFFRIGMFIVPPKKWMN